MATLRNKRKLAVVKRKTQEEHPRHGQSRNTSVPRINEEYITQVSEEIEGRVTKKLSQEFSRTECRILGALSKLDEFLLNLQIWTNSGTVLGTFRNTNVENQGTNEDDSQSDPHPEAGLFRSQTTQNSVPEVARDSSKLTCSNSVGDNLYCHLGCFDDSSIKCDWLAYFPTLSSTIKKRVSLKFLSLLQIYN